MSALHASEIARDHLNSETSATGSLIRGSRQLGAAWLKSENPGRNEGSGGALAESLSSTAGDGGPGPATRRTRSATAGPRVRALAERVESKARTEKAPVVKWTKRPSRSRTPANPRGGEKPAAQYEETSTNARNPIFKAQMQS